MKDGFTEGITRKQRARYHAQDRGRVPPRRTARPLVLCLMRMKSQLKPKINSRLQRAVTKLSESVWAWLQFSMTGRVQEIPVASLEYKLVKIVLTNTPKMSQRLQSKEGLFLTHVSCLSQISWGLRSSLSLAQDFGWQNSCCLGHSWAREHRTPCGSF